MLQSTKQNPSAEGHNIGNLHLIVAGQDVQQRQQGGGRQPGRRHECGQRGKTLVKLVHLLQILCRAACAVLRISALRRTSECVGSSTLAASRMHVCRPGHIHACAVLGFSVCRETHLLPERRAQGRAHHTHDHERRSRLSAAQTERRPSWSWRLSGNCQQAARVSL